MLANAFVDNAKVMAKGQVTILKDVREVFGVASGNRISFIVEGHTVRIINSAVYAMQMLHGEMAGEAERTGFTSDDDVMTLSSNDYKEECRRMDPKDGKVILKNTSACLQKIRKKHPERYEYIK